MTLDIRNLSPFSRFVLIDADSQTSQLLGKNNTFLNSTCISKNPLTICIKLWNNLLCIIFWHATSVAKFALRRNTDVKHFYWHADLKGFSTSWVLFKSMFELLLLDGNNFSVFPYMNNIPSPLLFWLRLWLPIVFRFFEHKGCIHIVNKYICNDVPTCCSDSPDS